MRAARDMIGIELAPTQRRLLEDIYTACSHGEIEVPPMPEVAARLARMRNDFEDSLAEIARVVRADPGVAGAIMHAANSALYCAGRPVGELTSAVVRLGIQLTRTLATSFALRQTFHIRSPIVKNRMRALWEHSLDVSALSYGLARKLKGFNPERALLAGLLHDIGAIPVLHYVERHGFDPEPLALDEAIRKLRVVVGLLVAGHWSLDQELTTAIADSEAWMRDPGSRPDLCDIVLVAQRLHYARQPQAEVLPQLETLPAYHRLGLCPLSVQELLGDAAREIAEIKGWLSA